MISRLTSAKRTRAMIKVRHSRSKALGSTQMIVTSPFPTMTYYPSLKATASAKGVELSKI